MSTINFSQSATLKYLELVILIIYNQSKQNSQQPAEKSQYQRVSIGLDSYIQKERRFGNSRLHLSGKQLVSVLPKQPPVTCQGEVSYTSLGKDGLPCVTYHLN